MNRNEHVARLFRERFGNEPQVWARAPGRVDLMGSHTDYNLGYVLTMAISRDTWIAARANGSPHVRIHAADLGEEDCFNVDSLCKSDESSWANYLRGVAAVLSLEGLPLTGFDGVIQSTVPVASGLSSSAALECATAMVFQTLSGWRLDARRMALLCQRAENEFVGVNCGILDQFSSCLGEQGCALLLDCRDLSTRLVPIARDIQAVICDTRAPRRLAAAEYAERRKQCEEGAARLGVRGLGYTTEADLEKWSAEWPNLVRDRSRFIVAENRRVLDMADALMSGDRPAIGDLTRASFEGARDLFGICSPPMLAMMDAIMPAPGLIGGRQAGAGFGGCMVALIDATQCPEFAQAVHMRYERLTGIDGEVYPVTAQAGAGLLQERA